jgi:hypothetical protein
MRVNYAVGFMFRFYFSAASSRRFLLYGFSLDIKVGQFHGCKLIFQRQPRSPSPSTLAPSGGCVRISVFGRQRRVADVSRQQEVDRIFKHPPVRAESQQGEPAFDARRTKLFPG